MRKRTSPTALLFFALAGSVAAAAGKQAPRRPALPPECEQPELRDVQGLKKAAQQDSALSMGLDSVATWCFDGQGSWNGGWQKKGKRSGDELAPDCARAVAACERAHAAVKENAAGHELGAAALADIARPYQGAQYKVKRAGVHDKPPEDADCQGQVRSDLFAQAQRRMEKSRVHAQVLAEYSDYRKWLFAEGLKCSKAVAEAVRKGTRTTLSQTQPKEEPAVAEVSSAPDAGAAPPAATAATAEAPEWKRAALAAQPVQKWRLLAERAQAAEADPDYKSSFLNSAELKRCGCSRVNAAALARAIENREGGQAGLSLLAAEDGANTECAVCWLEAYAAWRERATRQCAELGARSEFELNRLEQSDDGPSIPQRCFDQAREARAATQRLAVPTPKPTPTAPAPEPAKATSTPVVSASSKPPEPDGGSGLVNIDGYTYYRPSAAGQPQSRPPATGNGQGSGGAISVPAPAPTRARVAEPAPPAYDAFVPPQSYAPIPPREEGRLYVRISMSSACVAEILPGPIQARNGDLIVVPVGARSMEVKSPCGGVAEIYYGKEPTPRFSEVFARNQPVAFVFKAQ